MSSSIIRSTRSPGWISSRSSAIGVGNVEGSFGAGGARGVEGAEAEVTAGSSRSEGTSKGTGVEVATVWLSEAGSTVTTFTASGSLVSF